MLLVSISNGKMTYVQHDRDQMSRYGYMTSVTIHSERGCFDRIDQASEFIATRTATTKTNGYEQDTVVLLFFLSKGYEKLPVSGSAKIILHPAVCCVDQYLR